MNLTPTSDDTDEDRDVKAVVRRMSDYGSSYHAGPRRSRAKRDAIGALLSRNGGKILSACTIVFGIVSLIYCVTVPFMVGTFSSPWVCFLVIPALVVPALPWGMLFIAKMTRKYED